MSAAVNLLLLLSALLSALTGAGSGVRAQPSPVAVMRQAEVAVASLSAPIGVSQPVQNLPSLAAQAWTRPLALRPTVTAPLFLSRRRE